MYSDAIDHLGILSCRFLGGLSSSRLVARVTTKARFLTGLNIKKHEEDRYDMVIDRSKLSILLGCSAIKTYILHTGGQSLDCNCKSQWK